jgi:hypothetical protein
MEQLVPERDQQYVFRHNADVIVETVDPEGNIFNVKSSGDFCVQPAMADDGSVVVLYLSLFLSVYFYVM